MAGPLDMERIGILADRIDTVTRALAFATKAHEGQTRKYTDEPYINHPMEVAEILLPYGFGPHVIAAALLHDVIEDCGVTYEQILDEFGWEVADLVLEVTDVSQPEDGNRKARKAKDREHLARAGYEGQSIKLADIISNTATIVERDLAFAAVYLEEKKELLAVLTLGNRRLWDRASGIPWPELKGAAPTS